MDRQAILSEVKGWPVEERLRLIEEVWDDLSEVDEERELSDDARAFLDRRIAEADANPNACSSVKEVWARVVERYRQ